MLSFNEYYDRINRIRLAQHAPLLFCYKCIQHENAGGYIRYERGCKRCGSQLYLKSFTAGKPR